MENNKIAIYARVDEAVNERASMYVTKCKLLKKDIKTKSMLIEEALDRYMIENPL